MKNIVWFLAGIGAAAVVGQFAKWRRTLPAARVSGGLDLNSCTREQLLEVKGIDDDMVERILDNRPYRSKFDLLSRRIVPEAVFVRLRSKAYVEQAAARQSVQIALA